MSDMVLGIKITADGKQYVDTVNAATTANDKLGQSLSRTAAETGKSNQQLGNSLALHEKQVIAAERLAAAEAKMMAGQSAIPAVIRSNRVEVESLGNTMKKNDAQWNLYNAQTQTMSKETRAWRNEMKVAGVDGKEAFEKTTEGSIASALGTVQARRELVVLGHEAVSGNFSRMPGSFMVLASRANLSGAAIAGVLGPLAAVVAAGVGLAKVFADGAREMHEMNNALAVTNGYAGLTRGQMRELAKDVSATSTLTLGQSKELVTQLVASGRIGGQAIGAVAKIADDFANAMGHDVDKMAPQLVTLFADPAKSAVELNKQMHFLTAAEIERFQQLQRSNQLGEAQLLLAEKLGIQLPKHGEQLSAISKLLKAVAQDWSKYWDDAAGNIGARDKSPEEKLSQAKKELENLRDRLGVTKGSKFDAAVSEVIAQQVAVNRSREEADKRRTAAELLDRRKAAAALVQQTSEYQKIKELRDKIVVAGQMEVVTAEDQTNKTRAIYDLNKQIESVYRSIAAEAVALFEGRLAGALALYDIETKGNIDEINAQVQLGNITKQQGAAQRLAAALSLNEGRQLNETQVLGITTLKAEQRQQHEQRLQQLAAQANGLRDAYDIGVLLDWSAALAAQAAADAQSAQATTVAQLDRISRLDAEIQKIRDQTAEIGKTKAQIDLLKAAEQDRAIKLLEYDRAINVGDGAAEDSPYIQRLDAEIARLRTIEDLLTSQSVTQAAADEAKKMQEDFKRTAETIDRSLTDALMRGFESGKGFAETFRDTLVNMFKTTILKPVIEWVLSPISQTIAATLVSAGISGGARAAGIGGNAASGANALSGGSSLFNLMGGGQTLADFGNMFRSIGSEVINAAGEVTGTFGVTDAIAAFAAANPITAGLAALVAIAGASSLFGGGGHSTHGTGYRIAGAVNPASGFAGSFIGLSASDEASYQDPLNDQAGRTQYFNTRLASAYDDMQKVARIMGLDAATLASKSFGIDTYGPLDITQTVSLALQSVTDQMAEQLVPGIKQLQQANESVTQTFIRLAQAAQAAVIPDALGRMGAALQLKDAWKGIAWSDLNPFPMTSAQKLQALAGEFSDTLAGSRAGDMNAYNALAGSAQSYLQQARAEYASSQQYVDIYRAVQSDVGGVIQTTMTEQSNRLADMGLSLHDIVANTQNLDKRIVDALRPALEAWAAAHIAVQQAAAGQIVAAVQQNTAVTQQAAPAIGLVLASASNANWIDTGAGD